MQVSCGGTDRLHAQVPWSDPDAEPQAFTHSHKNTLLQLERLLPRSEYNTSARVRLLGLGRREALPAVSLLGAIALHEGG